MWERREPAPRSLSPAGNRCRPRRCRGSARTTTGGEHSFPVVAVGKGSTPLVIIPGLSDGLTTVEGKGRMMAYYCRKLPTDYRACIVSRPRSLPARYTTREMAVDYGALTRDSMRKTHTPSCLRRYRLIMPVRALSVSPRAFGGF